MTADMMDDAESRLARIERLLQSGERDLVPAWRRATRGEPRWAVTAVILLAVALQLMLPHRLALQPYWALPVLELVLLAGLIAANPRRVEPRTGWLRGLGLALMGVISLANGWAAVRLVLDLVSGSAGTDAVPLLLTGGGIWLTNVIVFALWYWEWDRGGPMARALGGGSSPTSSSYRCRARSSPHRTGSRRSWTTSTFRSRIPPPSARPT
ncbi:hypothetical protein [Streptomyces sp. NPDC007905]|uniref:hypothetical protein n=1 Tax=Streptomyces sp. NPDC007905 TaxID=3364788 RepID=UPI0036EF5CB2